MAASLNEIQRATQEALNTFGANFARTSIENNVVVLRNSKSQVMGTVSADGTIVRNYIGQRTLFGALVRSRITAAIRAIPVEAK